MKTLVIATHSHNALSGTMNALCEAMRSLSPSFDVVVLGCDCAGAVEEAARLPGCKEVYQVDEARFENPVAEEVCQVVISLIEKAQYRQVVCVSDTFGKSVLPRLAMHYDATPVTDVCEVVDANTFKRPIYAGNAIATVRLEHAMHFLSIRPASFKKVELEASALASIQAYSGGEVHGKSQFVSKDALDTDRVDLASAAVVVSGGRGLGSQESFVMIEKLASAMGAAVGASRGAVDAGFVPNDYQVGQTGKIVAPEVYMAIGISGAIQHLAGMKDSGYVIAINKDPDAPIFKYCDLGLVGDLFEIVPELTSRVLKKK